MKTMIVKLKLGVVLTGFILFASCGINSALLTAIGFRVLYHTLPSSDNKAAKSTGDIKQISPALHKKDGLANEDADRSFKARPISIGLTEKARLVSSPV